MSNGQIKAIIGDLDLKKEGSITDEGWDSFFNIFISPFQSCDVNKDNLLDKNELASCIQSQTQFQYLNQLNQEQVQKIMFLLDQTEGINLHDYIFLRRVNSAVKNCGDNYLFSPAKLYCALSITSPRTRRIYSPNEKIMFSSAIILSDGFYNGQVGYNTITQFIGVAYVYNYFNDYEIPFDDGFVYKEDMLKAVQEQILPFQYTPFVIKVFFEDFTYLNFFGLCQNIYSFRLFSAASVSSSNGWSMFTSVGFEQLIDSVFPQRLQFVIDQSLVPNQDEVEQASQHFWNLQQTDDETYTFGYNNLVFLQTGSKIRNRNVPLQIYNTAAALNFTKGAQLIFNIINTYNNQTINLADFIKFYRISILYLDYDPLGLQRITDQEIKRKLDPFVKQSLSINEKKSFETLVDYLQSRPDFYINYKEFFCWFFLDRVFDFIRIQGSQFTTPASRLINGFSKLGMRLSKYAIRKSAKAFDSQANERNMNHRQIFLISFTEEIMAMRNRYQGLLNTKTNP